IIHHYPQQDQPDIYRKPGCWWPTLNFRWHLVSWRFKFFDRYLDNRTRFARHAMAIDEQRADFDRVPWGIKGDRQALAAGEQQEKPDEPDWFRQVWFAGGHSDIGGGSYPEAESGLADTCLAWMVQQLQELPEPPLFNPARLHFTPDAQDVQHCAVNELRDKYPAWWPSTLRFSWKAAQRHIPSEAVLHDSVLERLSASTVLHNAEWRPYRPDALRKHTLAGSHYMQNAQE
ncbi:MAG: DUF2235 domain-containing protein, partial [Thiolinea sp.]